MNINIEILKEGMVADYTDKGRVIVLSIMKM